MGNNLLNILQGVHYVLEDFDDQFIHVEAAGRSIRVGLKNENGLEYSWWEPQHPFTPSPLFRPPNQGDDGYEVEIPNEDTAHCYFIRGNERMTVTLTVDPHTEPKPVQITWTRNPLPK